MADTTQPLPAITVPFVDRYRRLTPVWYRWLKPLLESLRATNVVVETVQDQYSVSVNQNGRIVAAIKLDGSAPTSAFSVLADKFEVVNPTNNGDTITAFVVGNVNGTPTVGINGNLIVDDTILARHIDVSTLSAISANIGTVTAGRMQSVDGKFVIDLDNKTITITT